VKLQERVRRAQKRVETISDKARAAYLWDRYEETEGEDQAVLRDFVAAWLHEEKPGHPDLQMVFPMEQYPNLYLWVTAVFNMRGDLAPERPITEPLPDDEIERRLAFLPPQPKRGSVAA